MESIWRPSTGGYMEWFIFGCAAVVFVGLAWIGIKRGVGMRDEDGPDLHDKR